MNGWACAVFRVQGKARQGIAALSTLFENRAIQPVALSPILFYHIMLAMHLCRLPIVMLALDSKTPAAVRHDSVTMPDYYNDRQRSGMPVCTDG